MMRTGDSFPLSSLSPGLPFVLALAGVLAAALLLRLAIRRWSGADRFDAVSGAIEQAILLVFFLGILGFSITQIILRNFFDSGRIWIDPLLRHLTLWIAFLGAFAAAAKGRHIAIDVVSLILPRSKRAAMARVVSLIAAGVCAALANGAWEYAQLQARHPRDAFLGLTAGQVQSILLFGFVILAYRFLVTLFWGRSEHAPAPGDAGTKALETETACVTGPEPAGEQEETLA